MIANFLSNFRFDILSFLAGVLAGLLIFWLAGKIRPLMARTQQEAKAQVHVSREQLSARDEIRLANDILRYVQSLHLASPFFSLDEIIIPPRLLAPPPAPLAYEPPPSEDITDWAIPYLPDWPELASHFGAPSLTLSEALQGDANLVLIGHPGSGKTVALSHLATQLIRGEANLANATGAFPILVHAADLVLPMRDPENMLDTIQTAMEAYAISLNPAHLAKEIKAIFEKKRALLLVDGLDEVSPGFIDEVAAFLESLFKKFPYIRCVAAASPERIGGLLNLGFVPIPLAIWRESERAQFIKRWGDLWSQHIAAAAPAKLDTADTMLIHGWLLNNTANLAPLELTLKVWAAYAGDSLGPTSTDALEAYLRRMTHTQPAKYRLALEQLASQMALAMQPVPDRRTAERWLSGSTEMPTGPETVEAPELEEQGMPRGKQDRVRAPGALPDLVESGMLIIRANERVTLVHPVISGYLACRVLAASGGGVQLVAQPAWAGRSLALRYLTMVDIQAAWLNDMLAEETIDALLSGLLTAARWLRDLPEKHPWMPVILRRLAGCLQKESLPLAIRARALAALVFSGNSGVVMLLRQSLGSPDTRVRQLSALGTGILRDAKAISEISNLLSEPSPNVNRAAILALVAIQDKSGLELVAYALIQGDEGVRRAAAEALTNYPEEGYPTLEEGCTVEDPGVRRAVVFGLSRVKQPWAVRLLEKMRTEDNQWLVQDAATQALDALSSPHPRIPSRLPSLTQTPWLISFAGERGMGVAPGKPAYELLYLALREGNEDQKQAALYYLSQHGNESAILPIYSIYFSTTGELQEASYNTLWNLAAAGVTLPPPVQYGYK